MTNPGVIGASLMPRRGGEALLSRQVMELPPPRAVGVAAACCGATPGILSLFSAGRIVHYDFCKQEQSVTRAALTIEARPDPGIVLSKAVVRAATHLAIAKSLLARILGVSPATVTRLFAGSYTLNPERKEWELGLLFVRVFRSLDSIVGNEEAARKWLHSENRALNDACPLDLVGTAEGLVRVAQYLDASRGLV